MPVRSAGRVLRRRWFGPIVLAGWIAAWAPPAAADTPYAVDFAGVGAASLQSALKGASQLVALADRPPASPAALRRRAAEDLRRLEDVAHAEGYWQARIDYTLDMSGSPARVRVTVTPGPLFHIGRVDFLLPSGAPAPLLQRLGAASVGLASGGIALSAPVAAADARIVELYGRDGYPFAKVLDRRVVVDVASSTMAATYTIDPGAEARFGGTTIAGLRRVERAFVTRRIAWQEGARYDAREVESTRQDLVRSGLFSAVRIDRADAPDAGGAVAMSITVIEGPPRSVGAGVGYNTNLGLGTSAFWETRNLFGGGESLRLSAGAAQRQTGVAGAFRRPDFLTRKLDLVADAELLREKTDAYRSRRWRGYVGLEDLQWPPYTVGGGLSLERAYLTESSRDENYLLLGTPLFVRRDTTDDLLEPTLGTRSTLTFTPYHGLLERNFDFAASRVEGRAYHRLTDSNRYVIAEYAALGSIVGTSLPGLPADKRFYAGGAGSVRGYGYQRAGPLDFAEVPIGGRSSLEFGAEFRTRITETIGLVPFIDAGNVYATNLPNRANLFYGAGLGLRYYTTIGPIRLDLAFPIGKRSSDSAIQVYISVGQAF
jgi:translocation and assembly module TamA